MKRTAHTILRLAFLLAAGLTLLPLQAAAETKRRTCSANPGQTLQHFLDELNPGDTLIVGGRCDNVVIGLGALNLTIEGQAGAMIDGNANPQAAAVLIRGRGITLRGFDIVGGRHGVQVVGSASGTIDGNHIRGAANHGVGLHEGASGRIVNNTIEQNGANGICVCEHSTADIGFRGDFATAGSPNTIRNNGAHGIVVADASYAEIQSNTVTANGGTGIVVDNSASAKIGFQSGVPGTFAGGNTITLNGNRGIVVARASSARIVSNVIANNTGDGVSVVRHAQADIASNAIDGNTRHGILVYLNSSANLGNDTGAAAADMPNSTSASTLNGGIGIACLLNSSVDGRRGTLMGSTGIESFTEGCITSLIP